MTDLKSLITNLRKLASAATPGPWAAEHTSYDLDSPQSGPSKISAGKEVVVEGYYPYENSGVNSPNDARFIAACDPQTILRLCDELEKAIEAIKEFEKAGTTLRGLVADESIRDVGKRIQDAATSFLNR